MHPERAGERPRPAPLNLWVSLCATDSPRSTSPVLQMRGLVRWSHITLNLTLPYTRLCLFAYCTNSVVQVFGLRRLVPDQDTVHEGVGVLVACLPGVCPTCRVRTDGGQNGLQGEREEYRAPSIPEPRQALPSVLTAVESSLKYRSAKCCALTRNQGSSVSHAYDGRCCSGQAMEACAASFRWQGSTGHKTVLCGLQAKCCGPGL